MAKIDITRTELVWPGKYDKDGRLVEIERVNLPFQIIETIGQSRATREADKREKEDIPLLYDLYHKKEGETFEEGWKNKLIWGDNKYVMSSLLEDFAGKIDLIYIDPPFATGADFSFTAPIGDGGLEISKEQSIIEEKAYRDTWGRNRDSWFQMINERLHLMRDLLAPSGTIYVHVDWYVGHHLRPLLDEIFGESNSLGEIVWAYGSPSGGRVSGAKLVKAHDFIFIYASQYGNHKYKISYLPYKEKYINDWFKYKDENGRRYRRRQRANKDTGERYWEKQYLDESPGVPASTVWSDIQQIYADPRAYKIGTKSEITGYPTQKSEKLLERIIEISSKPGDLVADFFCGSGTTMAVAERLGRRWIGSDLSRWAAHISRKRLLEIEDCRPFEVLNLGKYERKYWQGVTFAKEKRGDQQLAIFEYLKFVLKLYGAEPLAGLEHMHGKKGNDVIHVGAVDAPVTIDEINACMDECEAIKQKELHILGWEWEMGLYEIITESAKGRGIKLLLLQIPREVMEQQAVDKGDVRFFELAYLEVKIKAEKGRKVTVELKDFVIPNTELIPQEVQDKVKKWSDFIDYWAIDWDFRNDTFMQGWVDYRTRKKRSLSLKSDPHIYEKPGKYTIMVKVVDIFGNDTSQLFETEVK